MIIKQKKVLIIALLIASVFSGAMLVRLQTYGVKERVLLGRLDELQSQLSDLEHWAKTFSQGPVTQPQKPTEEVARREVIKERSQEELLTSAVAAVAPAVVSIVITKDVPKLEVVYENPFGDDPFFKDFNIRVPRYRQIGTEPKKVGAGTGFIVRADGYILTNRHVVEDTEARYTVLLANGTQQSAQVVYRDAGQDAAVIKIGGGGYTAAAFGDSGALKLGQSVFAIGNALGEYNNSVSVGIISGLNRSIEASGTTGSETLNDVIQTDAAINPGNSGGPLVDLQGRVIGVNVATVVGSNNISFSIPANILQPILESILR